MTEEEKKGRPETQEEKTPEVVTLLDNELAELNDFKEKYWLLLAESENQRKRMQKERHDLTRFAVEGLIVDLLPPLDHFEQALSFADQMSDEVRNWAKGFEMILGQLRDVLSNQNVQAFNSKGEHFDPHLHEAVESEESTDVADGIILEEFTRGYKMGDRIIRAARVKVAKAPKASAGEEKLEEQKEANSN